ncbi:efflux RND transporter periplasmic adaptor subunit [Xylanibacter muris]|uniref:Efflux RND transporter periplasmic adaptor subunit n=1 Tax=Xylanibacter muris TaxID=2736290 RepID=A0ABX2AKA5_9BACT|nr:efflux RND transporter periplasmic adaptor subunit [Xylanibacter muris]NPD91621.1 efflux RND transporter periplasmic adaptor subunit [Xylanibacter muris]
MIITMLLASCSSNETKREMDKPAVATAVTTVDTMMLRRMPFNVQLVCNGRLQAKARSEITFRGQGVVTEIYVHNGSRVGKGQLLAVTDKDDKRLQVMKYEKELERAGVSLADKLISMGYDGIGSNVPDDVMRRAKITSGYFSAEYQLAEARKALEYCELRAPFAGRVADIECQPYQAAGKFGKLIDDLYFNVEFSVLEAELPSLAMGQRVKVIPFIDDNKVFEGKITQINPTVDEKGMVKVRAGIRNTDPLLIDGLNVRVIVEKSVPGRFVVPKQAVVERDGYYVIFEVEDSQAVWTYVDIEYSNLTHYAITGCKAKETKLSDGEAVIISENQNLADGTVVRIKNRNGNR